jgi:hypothetical protein
MQSRVDEDIEITDLDKMAISSNAAVAVQVDEFHRVNSGSGAKYFGCEDGVA